MTLSDVPRRANEHAALARRIERLEALIRAMPSRPVTIGVSGPSDAIVDQGLTQTAHGFTVGEVVYWNGTIYVGAKANAAATALYAGVVSAVEDANTFDLTYSGIISSDTALSFTPGTTYYLSDATAGAVLAAAPASTAYQVPVFLCRDVNTLLVFACSGIGSSHLNLHAGDPTSGGGKMRIYSTNAIYVDVDGAGNLTVTNGTISTVITDGSVKVTSGAASTTTTPTSVAVAGAGGLSATLSDASLTITNGTLSSTLNDTTLTITDGTHTTTITDTTLTVANGGVSSVLNDASLTITNSPNVLSASDLAVEVNNGTANATMEATQLDIVNGSGESSLLDDAGNLTLTQVNGNVIQLKAADMASVTSQTAKMIAYQVCDTSTGTIKTALILSTPPT